MSFYGRAHITLYRRNRRIDQIGSKRLPRYNPEVDAPKDPFHLERFVVAQEPVYEQVIAELGRGDKQTHWIWFIFPQLKGLGRSEMAVRYAIGSREEATAYINHPLLGPRLRECVRLVNSVSGRSLEEILGSPDVVKFQSSVTLFSLVTTDKQVFEEAIAKYFDGSRDERTVESLD